jgi:hypothetical protein
MKKLFYLLVAFLFFSNAYGQKNKSLELSLIGRQDIHGNYVSNFAGRVYNDTNKISGFNYGVNVIFRKKISKSYSIALGLGYYRLKIDKIKGNLPFNIPGVRTGRNINYDDGMTNLLYGTTKYYYNNLAISLSVNKFYQLYRNTLLDISPELIVYSSLSQSYQLFKDKNWKTKNKKPLEFGLNMNVGILKEYKNFYLRPSLIIPVFQNMKGDIVFYEDPKMNITKWFNGIGLSLKIGKYF